MPSCKPDFAHHSRDTHAVSCVSREVSKMPHTNVAVDGDAPSSVELLRIVSLQEAARLSAMSPDTLKRRHADKIITLSPRRLGMRVRDALMLSRP
jgi:hypothetical protein